MNKPSTIDESGIPVFTAEDVFGNEKIYVQLSSDFSEFVGKLHKHEFIEVVYVMSGTAVHKVGGREYEVQQGDVLLVDNNVPHAFYEKNSKKPFLAYDLMFMPSFLDEKLLPSTGFNEMCEALSLYTMFPFLRTMKTDFLFCGRGHDLFGETFYKIYAEFCAKENGYEDILQSYMRILIIKLFRSLNAVSEEQLSANKKQVVDFVVAYVYENFSQKVTLEDLARRVFLSKDYLNKIFKKATGVSVNVFVQKVRIEEAKKLLRNTERTVNHIAESCGYTDIKFFYSSFFKLTQMTPGAYRMQNNYTKK